MPKMPKMPRILPTFLYKYYILLDIIYKGMAMVVYYQFMVYTNVCTHVYFRYKKVLGTLGILVILGIFIKWFLLHTFTKAYEY